MSELERDLRQLGAAVSFPDAPDLSGRVRPRLTEPRGRPWRLVAVAVALVAIAVGAAFAVPDSRSAILRFFGLTQVRVTIVDKLPVVTNGPAATGTEIDLSQVPTVWGYAPLLPDGKPAAVYVHGDILVVLYGKPTRLRLTELHIPGGYIEKLAGGGQVERLTVNGGPGLWIEGKHVVYEPFGLPRLSASVLIWEQGGFTIRIEAKTTKAAALRIAQTVRVRNP
jgi:hypothetical protein